MFWGLDTMQYTIELGIAHLAIFFTCLDATISIWVNGDLVNVGYDCTAQSGQIAIQAEGVPCEFRRIELRPYR